MPKAHTPSNTIVFSNSYGLAWPDRKAHVRGMRVCAHVCRALGLRRPRAASGGCDLLAPPAGSSVPETRRGVSTSRGQTLGALLVRGCDKASGAGPSRGRRLRASARRPPTPPGPGSSRASQPRGARKPPRAAPGPVASPRFSPGSRTELGLICVSSGASADREALCNLLKLLED